MSRRKKKDAEYYLAHKEKRRLRDAEYYLKNKDEKLLKAKEYYQLNKEKVKAYQATRYAANSEQIKTAVRLYYSKNPEKAAIRHKAWKARNPGVKVALEARREIRKRNATPGWANDFFIKEIYELAALRTKLTGFAWHVDHIIPLQGKTVCGLHVENNLQVIPGILNIRKTNSYVSA